jgi:DNA invertase Pin-like site-specific DNA recombinase
MIIGYARVSTTEQNLGLRHDDLKPAFDASVDPTEARKLVPRRRSRRVL